MKSTSANSYVETKSIKTTQTLSTTSDTSRKKGSQLLFILIGKLFIGGGMA